MSESVVPEGVAELVDRLTERLINVMGRTNRTKTAVKDLLVPPGADLGDQAAATLDQSVNVWLNGNHCSEGALLARAILKLQGTGGAYGNCEDCGEPISAKRLRVVPEALYCVQCQDNSEKRGINFVPQASLDPADTEGRRYARV